MMQQSRSVSRRGMHGHRADGMSPLRALRRAIIALSLLLGACDRQSATIAWDSDGGDAWTFAKLVSGSVVAGACDEIHVTSSTGTVAARRDGARFTAVARLIEGANELRAVCRVGGQERGASPPQRWSVRLAQRPVARVRVAVADDGVVLDAGGSEPAPLTGAPIARREWRARPGNPAPIYAVDGATSLEEVAVSGRRLAITMPARDGDYFVTLTIADADGREDQTTAGFRVSGGVARPIDPMRERAPWIEDAVVYGVAPSLFGRRGLADVTARLDEIVALGANVLWLAPITRSPDGDFGYAVTDHFRVRETFGTETDLRALVAAARERGIRVVLDMVPNHVSDRHPYFADAARRGRASPYFAFFDRDASGEATHYFNWTNLKNLNFDNPEVQRYTIEAFARWVRDFDVDGFRVDVSWGVRDRASEFWLRLRAELTRIKPDLLLLAEASARDPYYFSNGFDAAYDWTDRLGEWAWSEAFAAPESIAARLRAAIMARGDGVPQDALVLRFLNNNDTGARFVTRHGLGRTRVAAAMLMTLPGVPSLYMGDEIGAAFEPYAGSGPIEWTDAPDLRAHYAKLGQLRRTEPALRRAGLRILATSEPEAVLAYMRPGVAGGEGLLVLLNFDAAPRTVTIEETNDAATLFGRGQVLDVLSGEALSVDLAKLEIFLPGHAARVLRRAAPDTPPGSS